MHGSDPLRSAPTRPPRLQRPGPGARGTAGATAVLGALLGVALTACGGGGNPNELNGARLSPAIALDGTLRLSSPFPLVAHFRDDISTAASAASCAAAANGFLQDGLRYEPPHNPQGQTYDTPDGGHHSVTITLHVQGYHGPNLYGKTSIAGDGGVQLMEVDGYSYGSALGGDTSVQVSPDDSGQLSFSGLTLNPPTPAATPSGTPARPTPKPTPLPAAKPLTGTLTWTCVQERAPTPTPRPSPVPGQTSAPPAARPIPTPTAH